MGSLQVKPTKPLVYTLIGARGGSKGIPGKNLALILGHPLIAFSIAAAKLCQHIDRVIVSTDDEKIAVVARSYGAEVPFMRPKELAGDHSLDIEFFRHAAEWLEEHEKKMPDFFVHLRPTVPTREIRFINEAVSEAHKDKEADSVRSIVEFSPPAFKLLTLQGPYCKFFGGEFFKPNEEFFNYPRQKLPKTFHVNGYVDVIRLESFLKSGLLYGNKMRGFITPSVPDVDRPADLKLVEEKLQSPKYEALIDFLDKVRK